MNYEVYTDIEMSGGFNVFDFISTGKDKAIRKRVAFTRTDMDEVYNLAFGDVDENDEINDYSISNNGDRDKVLATIVNIIEAYTKRFPDHWIIFEGSTIERTRLYRMAIGLHFEELSIKFGIYTYIDGIITPFVKNMKVKAFLIKRKK